jgi:hypothetical protein
MSVFFPDLQKGPQKNEIRCFGEFGLFLRKSFEEREKGTKKGYLPLALPLGWAAAAAVALRK